MIKKTFKIVVLGKVQGVFYRQSARQEALSLGVCGTVKNLSDGSVEIIASGLMPSLQIFIDWCRKGPELASVTELKMEEQQLIEFDGFRILKD